MIGAPDVHPGAAKPPNAVRTWLVKLTDWVSDTAGHPAALITVMVLVVLWMVAGPLLQFSTTWATAIQVASAIVTIVMVFALQHAEQRHTRAMQLKLNELLRAVEGAREQTFADLEAKDVHEQEQIHQVLLTDCQSCRTIEEHQTTHAGR